jgi:hypothetical protein
VATVSANWKKLFLDSLYWKAQDSGLTLFEVLKAAAQAKLQNASDGIVLVGSSGNGASVTYEIPSGGPGPSEMVEVVAELFALYYAKKQALGGNPSDAVLVQAMKDSIVSVRRFSTSFRGMCK